MQYACLPLFQFLNKSMYYHAILTARQYKPSQPYTSPTLMLPVM